MAPCLSARAPFFMLGLLWALACERAPQGSQGRSEPPADCPGAAGSSAKLADPACGASTAKSRKSSEVDPFDSQIPLYDEETLMPGTNRPIKTTGPIPPEYKTKVFIAKRSAYHRAIWNDLTREVWASWNKVEQAAGTTFKDVLGDNKATDYLGRFFVNPQNFQVDQVAIFQPLKMPTFLPQTDEIISEFFTLGHTATPSVRRPDVPTLILAINPFTAEVNKNPLAEPEDYRIVFQKVGTYFTDLKNECLNEFARAGRGDGYTPKFEVLSRCEGVLEGSADFSANITTLEHNNAFDELFKKQSVAIWDPICPSGFEAVGQVATNGRADKPYSEADFTQNEIEIMFRQLPPISEKKAMYCVQKKFLAKGKLGRPIFGNREVTIYEVLPADDQGVANSNLFFAVAGGATAQVIASTEVWVLAKEFVIELPSDTPTRSIHMTDYSAPKPKP